MSDVVKVSVFERMLGIDPDAVGKMRNAIAYCKDGFEYEKDYAAAAVCNDLMTELYEAEMQSRFLAKEEERLEQEAKAYAERIKAQVNRYASIEEEVNAKQAQTEEAMSRAVVEIREDLCQCFYCRRERGELSDNEQCVSEVDDEEPLVVEDDYDE